MRVLPFKVGDIITPDRRENNKRIREIGLEKGRLYKVLKINWSSSYGTHSLVTIGGMGTYDSQWFEKSREGVVAAILKIHE